MDSISTARLNLVYPGLAAKINQLYTMLAPQDFRVTQGLRTWSQQAALYAQGRTAPGEIVTNAPAGYSWHEFGLAVDLVPMVGGEPDWDVEHPSWPAMISTGESLGLVSGSTWTNPDRPHFQMTGAFPVTPNNEVRQLFLSNGIEEVWRQAFENQK
jgi:hypothetical protein